MPAAIFRCGRCSATPICTRRSSFDAGAAGARLGPREAYRFAKGEEVISSTGQPARLSRPLDFLVVADHSDNMGFFGDFLAGKPEILQNAQAREWYDMMQSGKAVEAAFAIVNTFAQGKFPPEITYAPGNPAYRSTWQSIIAAAEEANDPGRFTAFIGYEWTSSTKGNNLHRNVILPRRWRQGRPHRALYDTAAHRQQQSARPVEMAAEL